MPFADVGGKKLWFEEDGSGPALVLIHAGVADSTMWDELVPSFAQHYRVVRYDLPGYGRSALPPGPFSHVDDLRGLFDALDVDRAAIVGLSHGARVELEFALEHPERVDALVLVAAGLPDHDWSDEAQAASDEEDRLFEAGDVDGATEVNLRVWVDGPQRGPDAVPAVRERVRKMVLRSFELYQDTAAQGEPGPSARLDPPALARLAEVRVPTLVVVGDADVPDILEICDRLAAGIPGAREVVFEDVAHMLPMERPEEFARLVLDFLAEALLTLRIEARYNGPPGSANGGYTCGLVAQLVGEPAEVTLRLPPPLDRPLRVERVDGRVEVYDGDALVAEARRAEVDVEPPEPVSLAEAEAAASRYEGFREHAFPTCFVCGPQRPDGDGLEIFAGPVAGRELVAAPWVPEESRRELVWAALDCPGAFAVGFAGRGEVVLGRFAVRIERVPLAGEACVVVGWPLGEDGRKLYAGTALFTGDGELLAAARATWIAPR